MIINTLHLRRTEFYDTRIYEVKCKVSKDI